MLDPLSQFFLPLQLTNGPNKLECLSLASLSSLVLYLRVWLEPRGVGSGLTRKHYTRLKGLTVTNTLAYFVHSLIMKKRGFGFCFNTPASG
jgi:hypothetical protein